MAVAYASGSWNAAHAALDRAVEACYRKAPFATERARVEFLFELHAQQVSPLAASKRVGRQKMPKGDTAG